jgi:hypothetical protein
VRTATASSDKTQYANPTPEPKDDDDDVDYRTIAKANRIKSFGRKKEDVIAELKEKGLM